MKMKQYAYRDTPFHLQYIAIQNISFLFIFFSQDFITIKTIVRNTCSFAYNYAIHGLLIYMSLEDERNSTKVYPLMSERLTFEVLSLFPAFQQE